jgi:hypothetical protein
MLHYDLSAKDKVGPVAMLPDEYFIANKANIINDGRFFVGLPADKDFAKMVGEGFRQRLVAAKDDQAIMVVTHVPCIEQLITRRPNDTRWATSTPFFGNLSHEKLIKSCSGHSHQKEEYVFENRIICRSIESDYAVFVIVELVSNPDYSDGTDSVSDEPV